MSRPELWLTIAGMALITYALRAGFLLAADRLALPGLVRRALTYVPSAVLAAIVAPALARPALDAGAQADLRLLATAAAAVVAWQIGRAHV